MNVAPTFTAHFAPLAVRYDVVLCDVWGVVHNSLVAFAEAGEALARFRARGGAVVLITNAPRPGAVVTGAKPTSQKPRSSDRCL